MNHAAEGLLQAYLDGETTGALTAEISEHVSGCGRCREDLERLRADGQLVSVALQLLDAPAGEVAVDQARWRARAGAPRLSGAPRARRFALGALARAAVLLLVLAGALAAIPGSPLRRLIADLITDPTPALPAEASTPPAVPAAAAPPPPTPARRAELPGVALVPQDGRVRVLVWAALTGATVRVNLIEGNRVSVEAGSDAADVRFRTASGRIEVMNLGRAEAVIEIPRSLPFASLEVDGRQWLFKDGDQLRLSGPVVEQAKDAVVFRVN